MLAIQLLAGEIPSLPPTRCVVIGLFLLVACWSPATLQPSGHPRVAGIFCGLAAFFFFFFLFFSLPPHLSVLPVPVPARARVLRREEESLVCEPRLGA